MSRRLTVTPKKTHQRPFLIGGKKIHIPRSTSVQVRRLRISLQSVKREAEIQFENVMTCRVQ